MTNAERDEAIRVSDKNLAEFIRHTARAGENSALVEENGLLLVAGSHRNPGPYRNAAIRLTEELSAAETLARADEFFARRSRGYVLWVRDHADAELDELAHQRDLTALEEGGLPQLYREGCPDSAKPEPGVELRWAADEESRRDFLMVNADAWGMSSAPFDVVRATLFDPSSLDAPNVAASIAYIDGKPAGTSMAIVHPNHVVGGYWGATAGWARKRGLHDLTTRAIFNAGFALGARISVCQTSPGAAGNVERMGFRQITSYRRYVVPASRVALLGALFCLFIVLLFLD